MNRNGHIVRCCMCNACKVEHALVHGMPGLCPSRSHEIANSNMNWSIMRKSSHCTWWPTCWIAQLTKNGFVNPKKLVHAVLAKHSDKPRYAPSVSCKKLAHAQQCSAC